MHVHCQTAGQDALHVMLSADMIYVIYRTYLIFYEYFLQFRAFFYY